MDYRIPERRSFRGAALCIQYTTLSCLCQSEEKIYFSLDRQIFFVYNKNGKGEDEEE